VPIFSPSKVVEAVLRLQKDEKLCKQLGREAKSLVEKKFTREEMLNQMEDIYKKLYHSSILK
jgi:glycosyltransferase involved in cell wall biosynthesis